MKFFFILSLIINIHSVALSQEKYYYPDIKNLVNDSLHKNITSEINDSIVEIVFSIDTSKVILRTLNSCYYEDSNTIILFSFNNESFGNKVYLSSGEYNIIKAVNDTLNYFETPRFEDGSESSSGVFSLPKILIYSKQNKKFELIKYDLIQIEWPEELKTLPLIHTLHH